MRKIITLGIMLLFLGMTISSSGFNLEKQSIKPLSSGNTLYVGGNGTGNYTKIQDAIDNASGGDTVFVYQGTYYEHLVINKTINLLGEEKNTTIIDSSFLNERSVFITSNANGVVVSHFSIINLANNTNTSAIIFVSSNNNISDNILRSKLGIWITTDGNTISYNNMDKSNGIGVNNSSNNLIYKNTLTNIGGAIGLGYSSNNIVQENYISDAIVGITCVEASDDIIIGNYITGSMLAGFFIEHSSNLDIYENIVIENTLGFFLYESINLNIHNNVIEDCDKGFDFQGTNSSNIYHNRIANNSNAFALLRAMNNKIYENNIVDNFINVVCFDVLYDHYLLNRNKWARNYWNGPRLLPKPIFVILLSFNIKIPLFLIQFDKLPARRPYTIQL